MNEICNKTIVNFDSELLTKLYEDYKRINSECEITILMPVLNIEPADTINNNNIYLAILDILQKKLIIMC